MLAMGVVLCPGLLLAQRTVQLGGHRFVPEQNMARSGMRSSGNPSHLLGAATNGNHNALVQLAGLPTPAELERLERAGITLVDYLGGNAYYALVKSGDSFSRLARGGKITSIVPIHPEWKLAVALQQGSIPEFAKVGASGAKVAIHYASNAPPQLVQEQLGKLGLQRIAVVEQFHMAYAEMPLSASSHVAALPWVLAVNLQAPPAQMNNYTGRLLGRAATLQKEASLGGRSLLGRGVKVGIWDGNVTGHVDFGNRVHAQEFETPHEHGVHVAGTVLGAGMVDPDGEGMAPKAEAWTYNFNRGSNGLSAQQEMALARDQFGITLTQNSYGISLESICAYLKGLGYFDSDYSLDLLAYYYPTLTHVFAAGNDQIYCEKNTEELWGAKGYGTATTRAKNAIHVGAVTHTGVLTEFSSLGPQDDGRMFPSICAKGYNVWSTGPGNDYVGIMDKINGFLESHISNRQN